MTKLSLTLALVALLAGCTTMKIISPNPTTGYFGGSKSGLVKKATTVKNTPIDLDSKKQILLVSGETFTPQMVKNIGYFDQVITFKDLEEIIIKENLTDTVPI